MNRRGFLTLLGSVAATAVLDVDKLLWVPGKKTIFVPPPQRFLSLDEINAFTFRLLGEEFSLTTAAARHYREKAVYHMLRANENVQFSGY